MSPWIRWDTAGAPAEPAWRWLAQSLDMPALLATPARGRDALTVPPSRLSGSVRQKFATVLGERFRIDDETRLAHVRSQDAAATLRRRGGDLSDLPDAVLRPRSEAEILTLLDICSQERIAVGGAAGKHNACVALDLSGMTNLSLDSISGLAQVEAGITGPDLARQLAARGMNSEPADFARLGGRIAGGVGTQDVLDMRLGTPKGILSASQLPGTPSRFGIVTAATLKVRALPASTAQMNFLFPDFASGLAAMRAMQRESTARSDMRLSDGDETRFHRRLAATLQPPTVLQRLSDMVSRLRQRPEKPAAFSVTLGGSTTDVETSRKRFAALAKRLGASAWPGVAVPDYRALLLDRGVTLDRVYASASWSELPHLYTALRGALHNAMRRHAPRANAHGLVLTQITGARHDGAEVTCTFLYPRQLNGDIAQAQAVRQAAEDVLSAHRRKTGASDVRVYEAIRGVLDPAGILTSD